MVRPSISFDASRAVVLPQCPLSAGMIYAITAAVVLLTVSVAGRWFWAAEAARRALRAQNPRHLEWRISCFASRLLMPSILAVVLLFLICASLGGPLTTQRWSVGLAVFVGVIGNHVDREVANGWQPFWKQCHDALRAVLPTFVDPASHEAHGRDALDCQALQFNMCHTYLLNADERPRALKLVFSADRHCASA
jgi:hypothetical protein